MKHSLIKLHWLLSNLFGLDLWRFLRSLRGLPHFIKGWWEFRQDYAGALVLMPCLHDRFEEGGTTKSEYFWQDLLVAQWIHEASPQKHVDVGSRVDGFVAHVASFREIEIFDLRPITTQIPGVVFKQADLMRKVDETFSMGKGYCDSLSCLHALEHFGLGRYGDPIDPQGPAKGILNMAALLRPSGMFYLSTPIGRERVEFNANHVFDPHTILRIAETSGLAFKSLAVISGGQVRELDAGVDIFRVLAEEPYNLGIYTFIKA
jgi:hypothetical protein